MIPPSPPFSTGSLGFLECAGYLSPINRNCQSVLGHLLVVSPLSVFSISPLFSARLVFEIQMNIERRFLKISLPKFNGLEGLSLRGFLNIKPNEAE
jgi:hypothetical protein